MYDHQPGATNHGDEELIEVDHHEPAFGDQWDPSYPETHCSVPRRFRPCVRMARRWSYSKVCAEEGLCFRREQLEFNNRFDIRPARLGILWRNRHFVGTTGAQRLVYGKAGITVDCLVRTIMAQATANKLALTVHSIVKVNKRFIPNGVQLGWLQGWMFR